MGWHFYKMPKTLAGRTGFEPVIYPVTGDRDDQATLPAHLYDGTSL